MNEQEALARLQRGDISGLEKLVRLYQVQALRAAYLITQDRPLAEDVVQEAFLRAYERIHQFDDTRPFGPWFLRLVVNQALKAINARQREVPLDQEHEGDLDLEELLPDLIPGPEDLVAQAEVREQVWEALGRLSPAQRAAVVLRYYLGFSVGEIAVEMNCSRGTAKRHLFNARQRLRKWLCGLVHGGGMMKEQQLYRILEEVASQEIPPDVDLWPAIRALLLDASGPQRSARSIPRLRWVLLLSILVLVTGLTAYAISTLWGETPSWRPVEETGLDTVLYLSQTMNSYKATFERVYADVNRILIGFTITGPENQPVMATGTLRSPDGNVLREAVGTSLSGQSELLTSPDRPACKPMCWRSTPPRCR